MDRYTSRNSEYLIIQGARAHNLKNINLKLPRNRFIVITGLSGSGKSSLAFDTIYAEGQRRYVESLSAYARQFLGLMQKPDVDYISGLSPAISIEQKSISRNPRSTVGTVTEIYDYLRLLFARIGIPYCYNCGKPIKRQTVQQIVDSILGFPSESRVQILAPIVRGRKGEYKHLFKDIKREGFLRVRIDGNIYNLTDTPELDKNKRHNVEVVIDRLIIKGDIKERLTESVELALQLGSGLVIAQDLKRGDFIYSEHFACPDCGISMEELSPRMFSFNSPYGACPACDGLGTRMEIDPDLVVPDKTLSLNQGAIKPIGEQPRGNWYSSILKSLARYYGFDFVTPWYKLPSEVQKVLLYGTGGKSITITYKSYRGISEYRLAFEGVINNLKRRYHQTRSSGIRTWIEQFMSRNPCPVCEGSRLRPESRAVRVHNKTIEEITAMSVDAALRFFNELQLTKREQQIARQVLKEIRLRLEFLQNVGLTYLTLNRAANTLSGGESQRIHLATQIGSQLVGVIYILDEPSIGLHQRDNRRLIDTLLQLRDLGNTVLVVEHDRETIQSSDLIVDLGPGAGAHGGEVVCVTSPGNIHKYPHSITAQYLLGMKEIPVPKKRRKGKGVSLTLKGARGNNLKAIDVRFPLGTFICVTGVSGSGKSTLINETLYPALARKLHHANLTPLKYDRIEGVQWIDKVIAIDQSPIGRTPRSNPATYTGTFTLIRDLFSKLKESRIRGYKPGRFSFNVKGGRCEACQGDGIIKIEMHFLPDVYVTCEECHGKRYNRETLEIKYRGKNISDILEMTVEEALEFFKHIPNVQRKLQTLYDVGLGYIKLGQQATTLSGGEAQRVKLATELSRIGTGNTLYILDEPTTGLHFEDVRMLLNVLNRLVDRGNTVIVIEHNLEVIKTADYIIDLGPEGGDDGGEVIAIGTPEEVAQNPVSYTGQFLQRELARDKKSISGPAIKADVQGV